MHTEDKLIATDLPRPNTKIISSPAEPIYIAQPIASATSAADACSKGMLYVIVTSLQTVAKDNSLVIQIENPNNSGKTVYLDQISAFNSTVAAAAAGIYIQADLYRDATLSVTPSTVTPHNRNFGYPAILYPSVCATGYINGADPITAGTVVNTVVQPPSNPAIVFQLSGNIIIPSNHDATFRIMNKTSQAVTLTVNLIWWES